MPSKFDGRAKRRAICSAMGIDDYESFLYEKYVEERLSSFEISELIERETDVVINPRSIQRVLQSMGAMREVGDAFRLAAKKGRVKWAYKDPKMKVRRGYINTGKRYRLMQRDGFKCVLCGATGDTSLLELDHIIPLCKGGSNDEDNLRTLCYDCNAGKRVVEGER